MSSLFDISQNLNGVSWSFITLLCSFKVHFCKLEVTLYLVSIVPCHVSGLQQYPVNEGIIFLDKK